MKKIFSYIAAAIIMVPLLSSCATYVRPAPPPLPPRGNPIGIVYPLDGTVLTVGASAVLAAAPHPNAARLFMEWLLSPDYAAACRDWSLEPVRADAEPLPGIRPIGEINTITVSAAEIARDLPEAIEQWRDTFGN